MVFIADNDLSATEGARVRGSRRGRGGRVRRAVDQGRGLKTCRVQVGVRLSLNQNRLAAPRTHTISAFNDSVEFEFEVGEGSDEVRVRVT